MLKPYENQWVALNAENKVIADNSNLSTLLDTLTKEQQQELVFFQVLPFDRSYAFVDTLFV